MFFLGLSEPQEIFYSFIKKKKNVWERSNLLRESSESDTKTY